MNTRFYSLFCLVFSIVLLSQNTMAQLKIERKIIIENEQYYFFTIDEETQLATLHTGSVKDKIINARKFQMPIGRELNNEFNPLCFDINNGQFIGINWILNSMNSRYEALKIITLKDWLKPHPEWTNEDWAQVSFNQPTFAPNEPWERMLDENNVLENCYFDMVKTEVPSMAICNKGKLYYWEYRNDKWINLWSVFTNVNSFSLVKRCNTSGFYFIGGNGDIMIYSEKDSMLLALGNVFHPKEQLRKNILAADLANGCLLIIDKDYNKTYTIASQTIVAEQFNSLNKIINESALKINL